jgi:hypothetical protein
MVWDFFLLSFQYLQKAILQLINLFTPFYRLYYTFYFQTKSWTPLPKQKK